MNESNEWAENEFSRAARDLIRGYIRNLLNQPVGDNEMVIHFECQEIRLDPTTGRMEVEFDGSAYLHISDVFRQFAEPF